MSDLLIVMGLASLPALANFLGGGLAEVVRPWPCVAWAAVDTSVRPVRPALSTVDG